MTEQYTAAQVAEHKTEEKGLWIIVDGSVYDVTKFLAEHPGGPKILKRSGGKDATKSFWKYHSDNVLKKYGAKLKIGEVKVEAKL